MTNRADIVDDQDAAEVHAAPAVFALQGKPWRSLYRDRDARLGWRPLRNEQVAHAPIQR